MEDILNSAERRLWLYMGMIHSASGMWTWCFSEKGRLYYTSCPNEKELQQFFCIGGCMDYAMGQVEAPSHPFIMGDTLGLTWAGEYVRIKGENRLVVIGPAFYTGASMRYIEEKMQKLNLSIQMRTSCMKIMNTVPVVPMTVFMHYIKMLHFTISFEDGTNLDVAYQDLPARSVHDTDGTEREALFDLEESNLQEALLLQCVRNGNTNYLARKFQKEMGVKLLDYIKEIRLEYAKVWLTTTDKSIQEISLRLQFGTRSYFSKVFKAKNGMTPAAFRNMVWNGVKGEEKDGGESSR